MVNKTWPLLTRMTSTHVPLVQVSHMPLLTSSEWKHLTSCRESNIRREKVIFYQQKYNLPKRNLEWNLSSYRLLIWTKALLGSRAKEMWNKNGSLNTTLLMRLFPWKILTNGRTWRKSSERNFKRKKKDELCSKGKKTNKHILAPKM